MRDIRAGIATMPVQEYTEKAPFENTTSARAATFWAASTVPCLYI